MWKSIVLVAVVAVPLLPLACGSSDSGKPVNTAGHTAIGDSGDGSGDHESGGSAGKSGSGGAGHGGLGGLGGGAAVAGSGGDATAGSADDLTAGSGGALDTGDAGAGGTSDGAAGATAACGALGEECCAKPAESCTAQLTCLASTSCSCIKSLVAKYTLRVDGAILGEDGQTPILDASTAQPLKPVTDLSDGEHHGCAVKDGGSVWCWRLDASGNNDGQLGNGLKGDTGAANRATTVLLSANAALSGVTRLAEWGFDYYSSWDASCAITSEGKLYCWGDLTWLVNNGTALTANYAQAITSDGLNPLTGIVQASLGSGRNACAVVKTGAASSEVRCWGHNYSYNLGQGDQTNRQYPTKVLGLTNPSKVVIAATPDGGTGRATTCALDGGQVRCWGNNSQGTAGINETTTPVAAPTLVKLQSGVVLDQIIDLTGNGNITGYIGNGPAVCALRSDGTVWCWGSGYAGYAANYGVTNVVALGGPQPKPHYVTSDGVYHTSSAATQAVKCGSLE